MKKINLLILGCGMYVCGRGTNTDGTIIPSLISESILPKINSCLILGNSKSGLIKTQKKIKEIQKDNRNKLKINYSNLSKLTNILKSKKFDCAIICVPDHLHYKYIKIILNHNIHVITVKPFVTQSSQAQELIKLAKKKKLISQVDFHKRLDEANLYLKTLINKKHFGDLIYSTIEYSQPKEIPLKLFNKWSKETNIFQYLGVHYVDLIYFLTGFQPISVFATGIKNYLIKKNRDIFDSVHAIIDWKSDKNKIFKTIFNINWIDPKNSNAFSDQRITLYGTKSKFKSDQTNRGISVYSDNNYENPNPYFSGKYDANNKAFYKGYGINIYKNFINDVFSYTNKKKLSMQNRPTFESSLTSVKVTEAVNKSLLSGKKEVVENLSYLKSQNKVLISKKKLNKNSLINKNNFNEVSDFNGISFYEVKKIKIKKIIKSMKANEKLNYSHFFKL